MRRWISILTTPVVAMLIAGCSGGPVDAPEQPLVSGAIGFPTDSDS